MSNLLSSIIDFISVLFLGAAIFLIAGEFKLAMQKQALKGTPKMESFTQKLTGESLDLSYRRIYGK